MQYSEVFSEGSTGSVRDDSHGMLEPSTGGPLKKHGSDCLFFLCSVCGKVIGKVRLAS